jgi:hypothetical protein
MFKDEIEKKIQRQKYKKKEPKSTWVYPLNSCSESRN